MMDLIGLPYRLGADGTDPDGAIDCIHLVYTVQERLGIPTPPFKSTWYEASTFQISRDLLRWGKRVAQPTYDGDVVLFNQRPTVFGVTWQNGILYINRPLAKVAWCPVTAISKCHCFRMRSS